jgi:hypothetical protein
MPNAAIWPGSSSFFPGETPFGFYDNDIEFQQDADRVSVFCARRLGYPLTDIELQDVNFYAAFEEAITTYGNEVYAYQVSQNYLALEGATTGSNLNYQLQKPNLGQTVRIAEQYGSEAGVGGDVTWYQGSIALTSSVQTYDLEAWAVENDISASDIEIRKIFYEADPAIVRYFDPYAGTGTDVQGLLDAFGFGNYTPGINFLLMPINYDLQKIQAINFNDTIRKSNYSFELINNQLRIFPIPNRNGENLFFKYLKKSERNNPIVSGSAGTGVITDVGTVPYTNPTYAYINSIGRQWVFEYTLALCKEMLGYVRGKYSTVPIPNAEVTLNQSDLLSAATAEKTALIERLRGYLDETSRVKLLEKKANEAEFLQKELSSVPYVIYIG